MNLLHMIIVNEVLLLGVFFFKLVMLLILLITLRNFLVFVYSLYS